ncbi:MAG: type II toxin-antitoxin system HicB family antitoxin [Gemmatimonadaceae bacterium]
MNEQQRLDALTRQPWTVRVEWDATETCFVARVEEIPDAIATGADERELMLDLWDAIQTSLMSRIDDGDPLPVPKQANKSAIAAPRRIISFKQSADTEAWRVRQSPASTGPAALVGAAGSPMF